jgi:hypothetical protein
MSAPDPYYAVEKLGHAVDELVAGFGPLRERVTLACLQLQRIESGDFPTGRLSRQFEWIMNRVNLLDPVPLEGVVNATVGKLPDRVVAELARRIVRLERELESYFRHSLSPPHTSSTE